MWYGADPTPMNDKKQISEHDLGPTLEFMRALWGLAHGLETKSKSMHQELGVTGPQRLALRVLGRFPGATPSDLASTLSLHRSTVTGIVQRLEERGLVRRAQNTADGRSVHLHLTAAGKRVDRPRKGTVEHVVDRVLARRSGREIEVARTLLAELTTELRGED